MLLESRSIRFKQPSSKETENNAAFYIITTRDKTDSNPYDALETAIDDCENIARDVLAYLKNRSNQAPSPYWFNVESARIDPIGMIVGDIYGVRAEFTIGLSEDLKYDPDRFDEAEFDYCDYAIATLTPQQLNCFRVRVFNDEQGLEVFVPPGGEYEVQAGIYISATEPDPNVYPQWIELLV